MNVGFFLIISQSYKTPFHFIMPLTVCLISTVISCPSNNPFRKGWRLAPSCSFVCSPLLSQPIVDYSKEKKRKDLSFDGRSTKTQTKLIPPINLTWDLEREWQNSQWKHRHVLNSFCSAISIFQQQYITTWSC